MHFFTFVLLLLPLFLPLLLLPLLLLLLLLPLLFPLLLLPLLLLLLLPLFLLPSFLYSLLLITSRADPHLFSQRTKETGYKSNNTIVFALDVIILFPLIPSLYFLLFFFDLLIYVKVSCPQGPANEAPARMNVLSKSLGWTSLTDDQKQLFPEGFRPVHDDIPIALLGAGRIIITLVS